MRWLRDTGLTIALLGAFGLSTAGMLLTGWTAHNHELAKHGDEAIGLMGFALSGEFLSALFENWESEFLQMGAYVILTAFLFQRGSTESKDPDRSDDDGKAPEPKRDSDEPWPLRSGPVVRWLYSYSLGIALVVLFFASFVLHWRHSMRAANLEARLHNEAVEPVIAYLADPQLWFESFQNWQSEFLSTAVLVVLSIVLRFKGSPESKPPEAPHGKTGH